MNFYSNAYNARRVSLCHKQLFLYSLLVINYPILFCYTNLEVYLIFRHFILQTLQPELDQLVVRWSRKRIQ